MSSLPPTRLPKTHAPQTKSNQSDTSHFPISLLIAIVKLACLLTFTSPRSSPCLALLEIYQIIAHPTAHDAKTKHMTTHVSHFAHFDHASHTRPVTTHVSHDPVPGYQNFWVVSSSFFAGNYYIIFADQEINRELDHRLLLSERFKLTQLHNY